VKCAQGCEAALSRAAALLEGDQQRWGATRSRASARRSSCGKATPPS